MPTHEKEKAHSGAKWVYGNLPTWLVTFLVGYFVYTAKNWVEQTTATLPAHQASIAELQANQSQTLKEIKSISSALSKLKNNDKPL